MKRCASKDAGPQRGRFGGGPTSIRGRKECLQERWAPKGGGIVMSHVGWGGEQTIIYKGVETFHYRHVLKLERESPKRTVSASNGSGSLQLRYPTNRVG